MIVKKIIAGEKIQPPKFNRFEVPTSNIEEEFQFSPVVGFLEITDHNGNKTMYQYTKRQSLVELTVGESFTNRATVFERVNINHGYEYLIYMIDSQSIEVDYDCGIIGFSVRKIGGLTLIKTSEPYPNNNCLYTTYSITGDEIPLELDYVDSFLTSYNGKDFGDGYQSKKIIMRFATTISVKLSAGKYTLQNKGYMYAGTRDSDTIEIIVEKKLKTPTLSVDYNELTNKAIISWNEIEGAKKYIVKRNGSIVTSTDLLNYETDIIGNYEVIATNSENEYLLDSEPAEIIVSKHWELNAPVISLNDNIIKWFSIENAVKYIITKNGDDYAETLANMFIVPDYGTYKVIAVADDLSLFYNSDTSNSVSYDRLTITLYNNSSETNRLDKNYFLNNALELRGSLRHTTSITNPIIEVSMFNPPTYNYAYIPSFGRYYYITDVQSIRTGLWELTLAVDVLMSFKEQILDLNCIVARNEFEVDRRIPDDRAISHQKFNYRTIMFDDGSDRFSLQPSYILGTVSKSASVVNTMSNVAPFQDFYALNARNLWEVANKVLEPTFIESLKVFFANKSDYILSITALPLSLNVEGNEHINVGDSEIKVLCNNLRAEESIHVMNFISDYDIPSLWYNSYKTCPPYVEFELYLPYKGWTTIDFRLPAENYDSSVRYRTRISYIIDLPTGEYQVVVYYCNSNDLADDADKDSVLEYLSNNSSNIISFYNGNLGVEIAIGSSNKNQIYQGLSMAGVALATKGASLVASNFKAYNVPAVQGGGISAEEYNQNVSMARGTVVQGINALGSASASVIASMQPTFNGGQVGHSVSQHYLPLIPTLRIKTQEFVDIDIDVYKHLNGRPLFENRILSDLRGYTEVYQFHLDGFDNALQEELNKISTALVSGILLPD